MSSGLSPHAVTSIGQISYSHLKTVVEPAAETPRVSEACHTLGSSQFTASFGIVGGSPQPPAVRCSSAFRRAPVPVR